jgi:hypothetical protein
MLCATMTYVVAAFWRPAMARRVALAFALAAAVVAGVPAQQQPVLDKVDPFWPTLPLPNNWSMQQVVDLTSTSTITSGSSTAPTTRGAVDRQKNVWVSGTRPGDGIIKFSRDGKVLWIDAIKVDSRGNVDTGEVEDGKRVQKFVPVAR